MKILISFKPGNKYDNFEGARMRKSIKGALESIDTPYTVSEQDYYDVAHLISPEEENKIDGIHQEGAPVVVSALYGEDDPKACYLSKENKTLTPKALKLLNKSDLIFVPTDKHAELLRKFGINKEIVSVFPGVNLARFDYSRDDEKEIFYRYYNEDRNKKLVIAVGQYVKDTEDINEFVLLARSCPEHLFYYIGKVSKRTRFRSLLKFIPSNVKLIDVPNDDVYRSILLNASVFFLPKADTTGFMPIVEAMAAKVQIIALKNELLDDILIDGKSAYVTSYKETLIKLTKDYLDGKIKPTTDTAYEIVSHHDLRSYGQELLNLYTVAIKNNMNRRK